MDLLLTGTASSTTDNLIPIHNDVSSASELQRLARTGEYNVIDHTDDSAVADTMEELSKTIKVLVYIVEDR